MPRESTIQILRSTTTDVPTGLTFGEIAYSDLNGKLFVGDNSGASRWVGAEVTSGTLSTNSQYLVPTQSAVKTYVDGVVGGGSVVNSINGTGGNITITGDTQSSRVSVSGTTTTITNRLATASATGVASFDPNFFTVGSTGHVRFTGATGETVQQGSKVAITKSGSVATINLDIPIASTSATGAAYFDSGAFTVDPDGKVKLASSVSFTIRDEIMQTDTISFGDTLTITGGRGIDVYKVGTDTLAVQGATATTTGLGVASFSSTNFDVAAGAVSIKSGGVPNAALVNSSVTVSPGTGLGGGGAVALGSSVTLSNTGVLSSNGATGAVTITGDAGSQQVSVSGATTTITNRLATVNATGVASFNSVDFTVSSGAVSLQTNVAKATNSVASMNGATGAVTITGDAGSQQVSVSGTTTTITNRLATVSATGVASFNSADFTVSSGAVSLQTNVAKATNSVASVNGATGAVTITGDAGSQQVSVSGTTTTITNRLATVSATGVASFATANFDVAAGAVSIKSGGVPNAALANSSVTVSPGTGLGGGGAVALGSSVTLSNTGVLSANGATGAVTITGDAGSARVSVSGATTTITNRLASTSATGVAYFNPSVFTVGADGGVNLVNSNNAFTAQGNRSTNGPVNLGTTFTITGSNGIDAVAAFGGVNTTITLQNTGVLSANGATGAVTITGDAGSQQVSVSGTTTTITNRLATVSATGVASFNSADFTVSSGAVSLQTNVAKTSSSVASVNGATGAITITGDAGSARVSVSGTTTTITNRLATTTATGAASFSATNFDVAAGAVSIKNAGVPNTALANSSVIVSAGSNNTISLGGTLTITGTANQVSVSSNGSGTVTLGLPNDITIPGNLTVNGTVVTANVDTFAVKDPLITLGTGNAADSLDLGFYGRYVSSGTRFAGLFRDASDSGKFKLFAGLTAEPTTIVDNAQSSFAIATLIAKVDGGTF